MTEKYERQCWSCGSLDLENKGSYVQCRACGATWNEIPRPGLSPVTVVDAVTGGPPRARHPTEFKPRGAKRHGPKIMES